MVLAGGVFVGMVLAGDGMVLAGEGMVLVGDGMVLAGEGMGRELFMTSYPKKRGRGAIGLGLNSPMGPFLDPGLRRHSGRATPAGCHAS